MTADSENSKNRHIMLILTVFICYYETTVYMSVLVVWS